MPSVVASTHSELISKANHHTAAIARHYENFTVVSWLLPKELRQHFYNVYAFCRHADDLADEIGDAKRSLQLLGGLRDGVTRMYVGDLPCEAAESQELILCALQGTVRQFDIPPKPFLDLIDAFEQDQRVSRYESFDQVVDYCTRSADPVGRLVLYMAGYRDEERQRLSDCTCTALQLTNFWQDVANDVERGRIYLPLEDLRRFGVTEQQIIEKRFTPEYAELMRFEVNRTEELFKRGEVLLPMVNKRVRTDIALYGRGGRAILDAIRNAGYNTLEHRPTLSKWAKLKLMLSYLVRA